METRKVVFNKEVVFVNNHLERKHQSEQITFRFQMNTTACVFNTSTIFGDVMGWIRLAKYYLTCKLVLAPFCNQIPYDLTLS